jgi:hypothetical protein
MNPGLVHSPSNNVAVKRRESKDDRSVSPAYVQGSSVPLSDVIDFSKYRESATIT